MSKFLIRGSFRGARYASEPQVRNCAPGNLDQQGSGAKPVGIPDRRGGRAVRNDDVWIVFPLAATRRLVRPTRFRTPLIWLSS
jgi:hypothetical protein